MARPTVEPQRRRAMIGAAIEAIHAQGSLDVTVGQIARRAGFSPALAHHYFGAKDDLLLAVMRQLLGDLGRDAACGLRGQTDGRARLRAIVAASFGAAQFRPATVSAWLAFYEMAQRNPQAKRLLRVYFRRLASNLIDALARIVPAGQAREIAAGAGALIDGLYLRQGLDASAPDGAAAARAVAAYLDARLP
ncbi:MAG: transcriptional regulator BetI [Alphaproteobacteria bacterium HGW-Alphaproteobacteria-10]|nr:MAG: transcriptional regulator BetI [Alphaproteobacteria bacterium HGW-Alphaproteobacteria-10]